MDNKHAYIPGVTPDTGPTNSRCKLTPVASAMSSFTSACNSYVLCICVRVGGVLPSPFFLLEGP